MSESDSKRSISRRDFRFLQRELSCWRTLDLLSEQQAQALKGLYEPKQGYMSRLIMALGAVLMGLGFLSYIAAHWMEFSRIFQVALVILVYMLSIFAAWYMEEELPKTSRALLLLGSFIYGGGIFLIAQIFNEGGHYTTALLWWMIGIFPAALLFRDRLQLTLLQVIALVYIHGFFWSVIRYSYGDGDFMSVLKTLVWQPEPLAVLSILWALWWFIERRGSVGFHLNVFLALNMMTIQIIRCTDDMALLMIFGVLAGCLFCLCGFAFRQWPLDGWGVTLTGVCGISLTIRELWGWSRWNSLWGSVDPTVVAAVVVSIVLLWCIYKGSTGAVVFFCVLILRYYFDRFYDFMPKAMFFTTGGILLVGMGFGLERVRKRRRASKERQDPKREASAS
ncbi:MAG: DUF2157 domain-containing protein [Synergistaceae bacterium]|nr:DUF2157 domain-containing protein [Synergistaceae bacterium]